MLFCRQDICKLNSSYLSDNDSLEESDSDESYSKEGPSREVLALSLLLRYKRKRKFRIHPLWEKRSVFGTWISILS